MNKTAFSVIALVILTNNQISRSSWNFSSLLPAFLPPPNTGFASCSQDCCL